MQPLVQPLVAQQSTPLGTMWTLWSPWGLSRLSFEPLELGSATSPRNQGKRSRRDWREQTPSSKSHSSQPSELLLSVDALQQQAESLNGLLQRFFDGDEVNFSGVIVDDRPFTPLTRAIYAACRAIPHGQTCTYGDLARQVERSGASRAVGAAMARNRVPLVIPCHRVVASSGKLCGFSAPGGLETKRRLLELERTGRWCQPSLLGDEAFELR